ncbi:hypothetical protein FBG13_12390 [Cobetia marina]|uniref:hypothetical protein n=1 Tax=Cobetia marina TaxID=28258 RepID=UPI0010ADF397|nr:hypothetical protein [Cobetia marina]TKD61498.1 hypothetical protein FBG13_12390 [Cobetia marina]
MKYFAGIAISFGLFSGCAALQSEPAHYDNKQNAFLAPGFPMERVNKPEGFNVVAIDSSSEVKDYTATAADGQANENMQAVAWNTTKDNTAVMTVAAFKLTIGSRYLEETDTDGYTFQGRHKIQYKFSDGRFQDLVPDTSMLPHLAPDCAISITLGSNNERKRIVGTYVEGVTCYDLPLINDYHREQLRQKAFRLFGLK